MLSCISVAKIARVHLVFCEGLSVVTSKKACSRPNKVGVATVGIIVSVFSIISVDTALAVGSLLMARPVDTY